ncbi:MAG: polysaccharide lyase 6 family protein [Verrucomicrobiaceae bacterium]|nr:polysaccharide lyase 6 family protein [Verrucomicrobiaceae bacterium]
MRLFFLSLTLALPISAKDIPVADAAAFADAAKTVLAGDTLILQDGTWADARLKIRAEGTAEKPVTIKAQTPGKVVFTGDSRLSVGGAHVVVDGLWFQNPTGEQVLELRLDSKQLASDCRITHCAVTNDTPLVSKNSAQFVSIYGARNRVDHCDHNHFGPRRKLGKNGGETIRLGDSKTSMQTAACVVEHNLFEKCDGEAECISNKSCGNFYRFNTFKGVSGTLTLRHGNRCIVENNVFDGAGAKGAGGVRVIGEHHIVTGNHFENLTGDDGRSALSIMLGIPDSPANGYFQAKHAEIRGNRFINCEHNILIGMSGNKKATLPPVETYISDNSIDTSKGEAFEIQCAVDGVFTQNNREKKGDQPEKFQAEPVGPSWKK